MSKPTFSILINNHNYADYISECVKSALNQSHPAKEIIIVDDGSNDDSLKILYQNFSQNPRIRIIAQQNRGQIAAMAAGIEAATSDIFCFLDSDDTYHPDYLKEIAATYEKNPASDIVFCAFETFGTTTTILNNDTVVWLKPKTDYDYGYTSLLSCFGNETWIGNVTSTISMRAKLARKLDLNELVASWDFSLSGDFVILLGGAILGGRKYFLNKPLVNYRHHETNGNWLLEKMGRKSPYKRHMLQHIARGFFRNKAGIKDSAYLLIDEEISAIPNPQPAHLRAYSKMKRHARYDHGIVYQHISWLRKLERRFRAWRKELVARSKNKDTRSPDTATKSITEEQPNYDLEHKHVHQ